MRQHRIALRLEQCEGIVARTDPQMKIWLPAELKEQVAAAANAKAPKSSMNAEIVARLTSTFAEPAEAPRMSDADVERIALRVVQLLKSQ